MAVSPVLLPAMVTSSMDCHVETAPGSHCDVCCAARGRVEGLTGSGVGVPGGITALTELRARERNDVARDDVDVVTAVVAATVWETACDAVAAGLLGVRVVAGGGATGRGCDGPGEASRTASALHSSYLEHVFSAHVALSRTMQSSRGRRHGGRVFLKLRLRHSLNEGEYSRADDRINLKRSHTVRVRAELTRAVSSARLCEGACR